LCWVRFFFFCAFCFPPSVLCSRAPVRAASLLLPFPASLSLR
jgi:hypothetical protein